SVMEIVKAFEKATCEKLNYKIVGRRVGDVESVYADTSLANSELDWKTVISLEETLLSAWQWEKYIQNKKNRDNE
ncbi:MAG TPA: hypothetical protein VK982_05220, partial [Bacteroidales bacterium]|nr:hypothetical protein [Bacteroidales bacterium]